MSKQIQTKKRILCWDKKRWLVLAKQRIIAITGGHWCYVMGFIDGRIGEISIKYDYPAPPSVSREILEYHSRRLLMGDELPWGHKEFFAEFIRNTKLTELQKTEYMWWANYVGLL